MIHLFLFQFLLLFSSFLPSQSDTSCIEKALSLLDSNTLLEETNVNLVVHRSGEPEPCAIAVFQKDAFRKAAQALAQQCNENSIDKYQMESILTAYFKDQLSAGSCGSTDNATAPAGLRGFCDMGPDRTTKQPDSHLLVEQRDGSLPCRFFTREGRRVSSVADLVELTEKAVTNQGNCELEDQTCQSGPALHLYAVPAGRVFMFAPSFVGEKFVLEHVDGAFDKPVVVEAISLDPRIFELYDFLSTDDAKALIEKTLSETDEEMGLHRSRTGATSKSIFNKRTSENAWDTHGEVAMEIKSRCLETLGFDDYWTSHTDGLQILRYKNTQAYVAHHDYLQPKQGKEDPYDYETSGTGGNRFATILLYFTDLGETDGGETLFEKALRPGFTEMPSQKEAVQLLRESGDPNLAVLEPDSWEETMTAMCRTRLSIQPRTGRAVLFYSQHPNGQQDKSVLHGGCPVLNGTKWAANLWVWNAPRASHRYAPQKKGVERPPDNIYVTFRNDKNDPRFDKAELFWKDKKSYGSLGPGGTFRAKTYKGHKWNIKVDGETVKTFVISGKEEEEVFII